MWRRIHVPPMIATAILFVLVGSLAQAGVTRTPHTGNPPQLIPLAPVAVPGEREVLVPPEGRAPLLFEGCTCQDDLYDEALEADMSDVEGIFDEPDPPYSVPVYLKCDDEYLYVTFVNNADPELGNYDQVGIYCDDNYDREYPYPGDDSEGNYWVYLMDDVTHTEYRPMYYGGEEGDPFPIDNLWVGLAGGELGTVIYEVAIPFGEEDEALDVPPGDPFGVWVYVSHFDGNIDHYHGIWPPTPMWNDPAYYGDVVRPLGPGVSRPDVWLKDNSGDNGAEPSSGWPWQSPDIWTGLGGSKGYYNYNNKIYATVRNRGNANAAVVKVKFGATFLPHVNLQNCTDPDITWFDSVTVVNVPAGGSKTAGPVTWNPSGPPKQGHWCLPVVLDAASDRLQKCYPNNDNNAAALNMSMTYRGRGGGSREINLPYEFGLKNTSCMGAWVSVTVDRSELPYDWMAELSVPEYPDSFYMDGYEDMVATVTVTPSEYADNGDIGRLRVSEEMYNASTGEPIRTTGGFTFDAVVTSIDILEFLADTGTITVGEDLGTGFSLENMADISQSFEIWIDAGVPSGDPSEDNPIFGPEILNLGPGEVFADQLSLPIPLDAELGIYVYVLKVGNYPTEWTEACFTVTVQGGGAVDEDPDITLPSRFELSDISPNPFRGVTEIHYALPEASHVSLKIYNAMGQEVATLVNQPQPAGYHTARWDARWVANGAYFYKLEAGDYSSTKKLVRMR